MPIGPKTHIVEQVTEVSGNVEMAQGKKEAASFNVSKYCKLVGH